MTIHTFGQDPVTLVLSDVDIFPVMTGFPGGLVNRKIVFGNIILAIVERLLYYSEWMMPELLNAWENYGGFDYASYYKDCLDVVHLAGVVHLGLVGYPIFILHPDFRPANDKVFLVPDTTTYGEIRIIAATGEVVLQTGDNGYVSLDGLTFRKG